MIVPPRSACAIALFVLAACGHGNKDQALATLRRQLATANEQSRSYLWGGALPVGDEVRALVENDKRAWWQQLTPLENFFLFEISPDVAARAPADVRAEAFCAGIAGVNSDWWSTPGSRVAETTQHALASKTPITSCLLELFDSKRALDYGDGEANVRAESYKWTVGDLAAGIVALSLGENYDSLAPPEARAARRNELRQKVH